MLVGIFSNCLQKSVTYLSNFEYLFKFKLDFLQNHLYVYVFLYDVTSMGFSICFTLNLTPPGTAARGLC